MSVDATKPTDSSFISTWPTIIRAIAALANANAAVIGGDYSRTVSAQNTSTTLTALDQIYTVNSASAVTLTLPEVTGDDTGTWLRVHKIGIGNLTVTAGGTDAIADGGAGSSIANTTAAEALAAFIELECVGAGQWMVAGMLGTWT